MGLFDGPGPQEFDNWVCILERGTEYEVIMIKNYLANLKIPSNILSKRDSSYNLNIGDTSMVYLYVPREFEAEARELLARLDRDEESEENQTDNDGDQR